MKQKANVGPIKDHNGRMMGWLGMNMYRLILNLESGYLYAFSELSWVNMYGYTINKGSGKSGKIIGDP